MCSIPTNPMAQAIPLTNKERFIRFYLKVRQRWERGARIKIYLEIERKRKALGFGRSKMNEYRREALRRIGQLALALVLLCGCAKERPAPAPSHDPLSWIIGRDTR